MTKNAELLQHRIFFLSFSSFLFFLSFFLSFFCVSIKLSNNNSFNYIRRLFHTFLVVNFYITHDNIGHMLLLVNTHSFIRHCKLTASAALHGN